MKQEITITLNVGELLYDVLNKTHLTGKSRNTGANPSEVANMTASLDEGIEEQLLRSIGSAIGSLRNNMSEYLEDVNTGGNNTLMTITDEPEIELEMPSNFNSAVVPAISSAMHDYVVNLAVSDWFTITNKPDASDYTTRATACLSEIHQAINKRSRPVRSSLVGA